MADNNETSGSPSQPESSSDDKVTTPLPEPAGGGGLPPSPRTPVAEHSSATTPMPTWAPEIPAAQSAEPPSAAGVSPTQFEAADPPAGAQQAGAAPAQYSQPPAPAPVVPYAPPAYGPPAYGPPAQYVQPAAYAPAAYGAPVGYGPGAVYPATSVLTLPPMSGLAVTGFVLSLVGMLGGFLLIVLPPAGLILSIIGLKQTRDPAVRRGRGLAVAGIVLGAIGLAIVVVFIVLPLLGLLGVGLGLGAASLAS